jgi:hypothetical protein
MRELYRRWSSFKLAACLGGSLLVLSGCGTHDAGEGAEASTNATEVSADVATNDMAATGGNLTAEMDEGVVVSASKLPYCDVVEDYVPADQCAQYADRIAHLQDGMGAFNPPTQMKQGETRLVELDVSRSPGKDEPASQIGGPADQKIALPMKVGRYMTAKLDGEGFKIEAQGAADQDLFLSSDAHWSWHVTAQAAATHRLILTTYVQTPQSAGGALKPMWTKSRTVEVSVVVPRAERWREGMASIGDWAKTTQGMIVSITALIVALGGLIAAARALFKPKPEAPPSGGEDSPPGGG